MKRLLAQFRVSEQDFPALLRRPWLDIRASAFPGIDFGGWSKWWTIVTKPGQLPAVRVSFPATALNAIQARADAAGVELVEYVRSRFYSAAGIERPRQRRPGTIKPLEPTPPGQAHPPAAARAGAEVRVPRVGPERFLAFLAEDRNSRWPAGRTA